MKRFDEMNELFKSINAMIAPIHENAVVHGWWPEEGRDLDELVVLVVGEVSELHEAYRRHTLGRGCDKLDASGVPIMTNFEEEVADIVIRLLDMAGHFGVETSPSRVLNVFGSKDPSFLEENAVSVSKFCMRTIEALCRISAIDGPLQDIIDKVEVSCVISTVVLACHDLCEKRGVSLMRAVEKKHEYNKGRPFKHGGLAA